MKKILEFFFRNQKGEKKISSLTHEDICTKIPCNFFKGDWQKNKGCETKRKIFIFLKILSVSP